MSAAETVDLYRRWAQIEAHGSSAIYERLALAVAEDPAAVAFLETMEPAKRQPNLLFGALRWHDVDVGDQAAALSWLHQHPEAVREVMRTRRTQTNEAARCATLLPALAQLRGPLALIEVGASAGLCLLYDVWRYHYTGPGVDHWVGPADGPVTVSCSVDGLVPLPDAVPDIVWRAGLDLSPIDASDPDARRWLQCLVWPEHDDRARTLRAALDVAADMAPRIDSGDLVLDLPELLAQAPSDATVVVVHSATLSQVEPHQRDAFVGMPARHGAHRLGAEGSKVLPRLVHQIPEGVEVDGRHVVSLDEDVLGVAHPHGRTLTWL
ncbi:MAG: DUF2332 domain-containing protein [Pseudonocardiaceae bacterium]